MRPTLTAWRRRYARTKGFTLIESMVALVIFVVGAMGVVYLFFSGTGLTKMSQAQTSAYLAAQDMVSMIRADTAEGLSYNNINTGGAAPTLGSGGAVEQANAKAWEAIFTDPSQPNQKPATPAFPGSKPYGTVTVTQLPVPPSVLIGPGGCPCQVDVTVVWGAAGQYEYSVQTAVGY